MVFYEFDYESFPNVKIIFNGKVNNDDLEEMFKEWLSIYKRKTDFNIIFDITKVRSPTVYFAYKMANFINILRRQTPQYFKKSFVIAPNSKILRCLLKITFSISKPVSQVYIYWKNKNEQVDVNNILHIFNTNMFKFNYVSNK